MRFLGLCNDELKTNNQSLAKFFPLTCALHRVPRTVYPAKRTGWAICNEDCEREFCPELEGVIFPMVWFVWHSLPGIFFFSFSFTRKGRNEEFQLLTKSRGRWGSPGLLLLADKRCDVVPLPICRAFLETWTLFFSESPCQLIYILKERKWKSKGRKGILRSRFLKRTGPPWEHNGMRWDRAEDDCRRVKTDCLSSAEFVEFAHTVSFS